MELEVRNFLKYHNSVLNWSFVGSNKSVQIVIKENSNILLSAMVNGRKNHVMKINRVPILPNINYVTYQMSYTCATVLVYDTYLIRILLRISTLWNRRILVRNVERTLQSYRPDFEESIIVKRAPLYVHLTLICVSRMYWYMVHMVGDQLGFCLNKRDT